MKRGFSLGFLVLHYFLCKRDICGVNRKFSKLDMVTICCGFVDGAALNDTSLTRRRPTRENDSAASNSLFSRIFAPVDLDYELARIRAERDQAAAEASTSDSS